MSQVTQHQFLYRSASSIRREVFVAELGRQALSGREIPALFESACRHLADLLDADLVKVLQLEPDGRSLRMVAGVGWPDGLVGVACVENDRKSQAGYTLAIDTAVVVHDLQAETRFSPPTLLQDHQVVSGMSTPIHTRDHAFGVLGVHACRKRAYSIEDTHFLTAVANVLGAALTNADAWHGQQRSTTLFRLLFEGSSDLVLLVDEIGTVRAVNPAGARALGYPAEAVTGSSAFKFVHPEDSAKAVAGLEHALSADHPIELDLRVATSNGEWRTLEAIGRRADLAPGTHTVVINARDVTERRVLDEKVRRSQRLETVGAVAASVAHDLNNILQVITSSASLLHDALVDPALKEEANEILTTSALASKFLRGLLALTRVSEVKRIPVELNSLIDGIMPFLRRLLGSQIDLVFIPTKQATTILGDPSELEQILINLVINARDAMPEGGPISIATWRTYSDGSRPGVVLSIADRGVGMTEEVQAQLFEPLFTTKAPARGTGLGLTIVHSLATRANATIEVSSTVGVGSTFEITFPAARP